MPEMKTLNGLEVVDAQARADIEAIKLSGGAVVPGDSVTKSYVDGKVAELEAAIAQLNAKIEGGNA